jgi:chromosome segregation ATPase
MNPKLIAAGILAAIILGLGLGVKYYKGKYEDLQAKFYKLEGYYNVCTQSIKDQNEAIKKAGQEKKDLEDKLDEIAKKNREALENNKKLQEALSKRPLPMTCPDQLKEVREIGVELSKGWNK